MLTIDQLYNHMSTAIISAGRRILGEATGRIKPSLTDKLYGKLKRARETRREMNRLTRGYRKEQMKKQMFDEYREFYQELILHRKLSNTEFLREQKQSKQGKAW